MSALMSYQDLVSRNSGYVGADVQDRIRNCRLLIAGCGIGSSPAVCAARMGFENFVLVDGDTVDLHNLNRQFYDHADVGRLKVEALREKILRINPHANVVAKPVFLTAENIDDEVRHADVIFDTVDFLDLPAIMQLHASAAKHRVQLFTALSVGFGALVWSFPSTAKIHLTDILSGDLEGYASAHDGAAPTYADIFASFIRRLAPYLDSEVVVQVDRVLSMMREGKPCPAPQVAVGSFAIGAMAVSMIHDHLSGQQSSPEAELIIHSFRQHATQRVSMERLLTARS